MLRLNLLPYAIAWAALGVVVLVLAILRSKVAAGEDDTLKLSDGEAGELPKQQAMAVKLAGIEKWGKTLTVLLVVSGLILGVWYCLQLWFASSTAGLE